MALSQEENGGFAMEEGSEGVREKKKGGGGIREGSNTSHKPTGRESEIDDGRRAAGRQLLTSSRGTSAKAIRARRASTLTLLVDVEQCNLCCSPAVSITLTEKEWEAGHERWPLRRR